MNQKSVSVPIKITIDYFRDFLSGQPKVAKEVCSHDIARKQNPIKPPNK